MSLETMEEEENPKKRKWKRAKNWEHVGRWKGQEGGTTSTSFCSVVRAILSRRRYLLALFLVCSLLLLHSVLTAMDPRLVLQSLERLEDYARSRSGVSDEPRQGPKSYASAQGAYYRIGGFSVVDTVDWFHPVNLGIEPFSRSNASLEGAGFTSHLWGSNFVDEKGHPKRPLPTNTWWQPLVLPPGTGVTHVVNTAPYLVSVVTKPLGRTDLVGDKAGLRIRGPYTVLEIARDGGIHGYRQANGPIGYGFFMGVRLRDYGDFVKRHYVRDSSPLSVTKSWEIQQFGETEDEVVDPLDVITSTVNAHIVRGSPWITMELPAGHKLLLESLPADEHTGKKNGIQKLVNIAGLPSESSHKCPTAASSPIISDALELHMSDGTLWLVIFDHKVALSCEPGKSYDRLLSFKRLTRPLIVRLALASVCGHSHVSGGGGPLALPGVSETCPSQAAMKRSDYRWKLMSLLNAVPGRRIDKAVEYIRQRGTGKTALENVFFHFPLKSLFGAALDYMKNTAFSAVQRQLEMLSKDERWGGFELLTAPWQPEALINNLKNTTEPIDAVVIPPNYYHGDGPALTGELYYWLAINFVSVRGGSLVLLGGLNGDGKTKQLLKEGFNIQLEPAGFFSYNEGGSPPHRTRDVNDTPPYEDDEGIDDELRPRLAPDSCDGAANAVYYWGNGVIAWLGMSWNEDVLLPDEDWTVLLSRSLRQGTCLGAARKESDCSPLKKVLLIEPQAYTEQQEFLEEMSTTILDKEGNPSIESISRYLRGTKMVETANVGEASREVIDKDYETTKDSLLRQALLYPVEGTMRIRTSSVSDPSHLQHAKLSYEFLAYPLPGFTRHSLYPPVIRVPVEGKPKRFTFAELWDPSRMMVYLHELQRKLEYPDPTEGPTLTAVTLEGHLVACLVTSHGNMCGRSFAPKKASAELHTKGRGVWMRHYVEGVPAYLLINLVESELGKVGRRNEFGQYEDITENLDPQWQNVIRWAVRQDLDGPTRLDSGEFERSADEMQSWARLMHRYANLALAANTVGIRLEREKALGILRRGLEKLLASQFENVLLYDATWDTKEEIINPHLADACPALRSSRIEAGAGLYYGTHMLFGYIVHMAAVLAKFDPGWVRSRLNVVTPYGLKTPKIHYMILALIRTYANPAFLEVFESAGVASQLQKHFVVARHKDWWFLNSYSSGIQHPDELGPHQESSSEAAFAYWAVALYAKSVEDANLQQWGRLLAATEIFAANAFIRLKEWNEIYPPPVRYLGAVGRLHENAALFQTVEGVTPYQVFNKQVVPFTTLSFETLDPGWALWVTERWQNACVHDIAQCFEEYGDLGLTQMSLFTKEWKERCTGRPFSVEDVDRAQWCYRKLTERHTPSPLENAELYKKCPCTDAPLQKDPSIVSPAVTEAEIEEATRQILHIHCYKVKSFNCGVHTLSNSFHFAAISHMLGGATGMLDAEDGNGRFRVY